MINAIDLAIEASEKIDREIAPLHQKRARVRGELNEHLSATRNLFPEVLTEIFWLSACRLSLRENLNCTRSRYRCFSNLVLLEERNLACFIPLDHMPPGPSSSLDRSSRSCFPMQEVVASLLKWTWPRYLTKAYYSFFNITERRFEPSEFDYLIMTLCAIDGISWHLIFHSPQNGRTSQNCGCFHRVRRRYLVWCSRSPELIPSTTAERNRITSRGVHRCNNLLPSVYVMSLSTNVSICSSTALILLNFIVPLKE